MFKKTISYMISLALLVAGDITLHVAEYLENYDSYCLYQSLMEYSGDWYDYGTDIIDEEEQEPNDL